jgi:hypothetical protein
VRTSIPWSKSLVNHVGAKYTGEFFDKKHAGQNFTAAVLKNTKSVAHTNVVSIKRSTDTRTVMVTGLGLLVL